MSPMSLAHFISGYIECALWAESANTTDSDRSIGNVAELSDEGRARLTTQATTFYNANEQLIAEANDYRDPATELCNPRDDEHLGHDFWLSRNGHGTGFWDRGLGAVGERLHDAAKHIGQCDLYIGDDGLIYVS